jgi:2-iminobutanoate/2-iminopropanoate deaminase
MSELERSELERITAPEAPSPTGPFVHAVRVGTLLYTSGQAGRDRRTGVMGTVGEQVDQALANLDDIAIAAGTSLRRAVKVTLILREDVADMAAVNAAYAAHFPDGLPARTSFFVTRLKNPDMLVEIEAVIDAS